VDRSLGRQVAGGGEGMEAVAGEFVGGDVVAEVTAVRALGQWVADQVLVFVNVHASPTVALAITGGM
jgi:hypothetical protein